MTTFKDLKIAYQRAVESGSKEFSLGGRVFVTEYAKYVIEYMTMCGARNMQEVSFRE